MRNTKIRSLDRVPPTRVSRAGFTLIELLTVIAIIGILAGIIIPTVGAVRNSAKKAKTRTQFSQWVSSFTLFKQEYGYFPQVTTSTTNRAIDPTKFIGALSGKDYQGTVITPITNADLAGNKKRISFYGFSDADLLRNAAGATVNEVIESFSNSQIVMLIDVDNDGLIKDTSTELVRQNLQPGNSVVGLGATVTTPAAQFPADGLRMGVAFYSVGKGDSNSDIVYSW